MISDINESSISYQLIGENGVKTVSQTVRMAIGKNSKRMGINVEWFIKMSLQYCSRETYHLSSREKRESLNRWVWNILLARNQCTLANWWHSWYRKVRSTQDIYQLAMSRGIFVWIKILLPNWLDHRYRKVRSTQLRYLSTCDKLGYICLNPIFLC